MNRTRPKQIVIRMSEEEQEKLKEQVLKSGMTQQEYLLTCILNKKIINLDGVKSIIPDLKRIGNNINQLTKSFHINNTINNQELVKIREEFKEVWQLLSQLTQGQA